MPGKRSRNNSESNDGDDTSKRSKTEKTPPESVEPVSTAEEIKAALKFLKQLAQSPTSVSNSQNEKSRATILALNRALYDGPTLGQKSKKKSKPTECSPRLFLDIADQKSTRVAAGGPSQKHTFGSLESYLYAVAQCYYKESTPVEEPTAHSRSGSPGATDTASNPTTNTTTTTTTTTSSSSSSATTSSSTLSASASFSPPLASVYLQRETILGKLSNMWRERSPMDTWAPLEIALFESAMCIHGKGAFFLFFFYITLTSSFLFVSFFF